jgi:hypothetical protein
MPVETPMHHSATKTASAARSFRIEVPPLGSPDQLRPGRRSVSQPTGRPTGQLQRNAIERLTSPHAVTVSTAEHSNEGLTKVWDLIVGGENLHQRAGRHPARQREASTLHFGREEISHRHIRRCVGNDQHGRRDLDEPHHFTSPNRQASK